MNLSYKGHRFPPEIISHSVWLYHRFTLSFRDVEDLMAERGIIVFYEAIRFWCLKFGPKYARTLRKKRGQLGDTWHMDELFVKIQGQQFYLWPGLAACGFPTIAGRGRASIRLQACTPRAFRPVRRPRPVQKLKRLKILR